MLSDEERKVMDSLKVISEYAGDNYLAKEHRRKLKLLIELVEKQSKEIEELTSALLDSTPNDKIKEILGIEEDINNEKLLSLLQIIVDENARLEDIEDRKVQIEYNNVFNKGVKSVEDKIKAKIEEKFLEAKGLYERGVQPQALYTMKLLRDLEKSLLEKE